MAKTKPDCSPNGDEIPLRREEVGQAVSRGIRFEVSTVALSMTNIRRTAPFAFTSIAVWLCCATLASGTSRVDPQALGLLKRMSDTLSAEPAFTFHSESAVEVPAATGQFLTVFSHADVALKRPDKLSASFTGDAPNFRFYYDGRVASAFAPGTGVFSTSPAPATIDAMLPALEKETGIRLASAPLLLSNPYAALTRGLIGGIVVGPATVGGKTCTHLAFRSPGVNWEIWIENTARALPRRLAVTFTDRPNSPRTLVEYSQWNFRPALRARDFVLRPPLGAKEIPFDTVVRSTRR